MCVRFIPRRLRWHPATDKLWGNDVYGNKNDMKQPWSIKFSDKHFSQFKFSSGDGKHWMIMDKDQVYGEYNFADKNILKFSRNSITKGLNQKVKLNNRINVLNEPILKMTQEPNTTLYM